jgi:putative transcriptional regulator
MNPFGSDLIQSLCEALPHAKGKGQASVHVPLDPCGARKQAKLTQAQIAPLMGMNVPGYLKWEQGKRNISSPAVALLRIVQSEPEVVQRVLEMKG